MVWESAAHRAITFLVNFYLSFQRKARNGGQTCSFRFLKNDHAFAFQKATWFTEWENSSGKVTVNTRSSSVSLEDSVPCSVVSLLLTASSEAPDFILSPRVRDYLCQAAMHFQAHMLRRDLFPGYHHVSWASPLFYCTHCTMGCAQPKRLHTLAFNVWRKTPLLLHTALPWNHHIDFLLLKRMSTIDFFIIFCPKWFSQ